MMQRQTNNQDTNAYEVTNQTYTWGASIDSMAAHLKQFQSTGTPSASARASREQFYLEFWKLSRKRAQTVLWSGGFEGAAPENAEDAASMAVQTLLQQECQGRGVFGTGFPAEEELRKYLSGAVKRGASQRVGAILQSDKRARGLSPAGMEAFDEVPDPRHEEFDLKRLCLDVREASIAIAPKYKGRLPEAGTTPLHEVLISVCLDKVEAGMAKRTYQRLQKDIRDDLAEAAGVDIFGSPRGRGSGRVALARGRKEPCHKQPCGRAN